MGQKGGQKPAFRLIRQVSLVVSENNMIVKFDHEGKPEFFYQPPDHLVRAFEAFR
jgi:hypothetical protein